MKNLEQIIDQARESFEARTRAREKALTQARQLTRHSAHAIRAIHRNEDDSAQTNLKQARSLANALKADLADYPDLYFAGYTQDAIKEYAEASITNALIKNIQLPTPTDLGIEHAAYVNGLAETVGEMRRRCLDILRQGYSQEAERLLTSMDDIYAELVTLDFPDAVTNGLRRQTDVVRAILERTRGDLTVSQREQELQTTLENFMKRLPPVGEDN